MCLIGGLKTQKKARLHQNTTGQGKFIYQNDITWGVAVPLSPPK